MDAYIYNADILCAPCGERVRRELNEAAFATLESATGDIHADRPREVLIEALGFDPEVETEYDSDDYPKGPYGDGGGEADAPAHCGMCDLFLENPLTFDGYEYVRDALQDGNGVPDVLAAWFDYYFADDLREIVPVEKLSDDAGANCYVLANGRGDFVIDFDGLRGDDRIRDTFDPNDWSAGDYTFAEDTEALYLTGTGEMLWQSKRMRDNDRLHRAIFGAPAPVISAATRGILNAWARGDADTPGFRLLARLRTVQLDLLDGDCLAAVMAVRDAEG